MNPTENLRNGSGHGRSYKRGELTPKQEGAAVALASGASMKDAAKKAGTSVTTLYVWLSDEPALKPRIQELRAEMTSRAVGVLVDAMTDAANTLRRLCLRGKSEGVRLKAAEALLTHGALLGALADVERRVQEMEGDR